MTLDSRATDSTELLARMGASAQGGAGRSAGAGRHPAAARAEARYLPRDAVTERVSVKPRRARRALLLWRRANRRVTVQIRSPVLWLAESLANFARRLWAACMLLLAVAALGGAVHLARIGIARVVASPGFAIKEIRIAGAAHIPVDDIARLAGVAVGDRLLDIDTDAVAARLVRHPWIAAAQARRELPSTFVIDVVERHASALAVMEGGLYLVDERGRLFKRATLEETEDLVVLTGISRRQYIELRAASEAAMREALELLTEYQHAGSLTLTPAAKGSAYVHSHVRPPLSEIHIDPRSGYTLVLLEGGAQIRLGRGDLAGKLARLDKIVAGLRANAAAPPADEAPRAEGGGAPGAGGADLATLRMIHLDGPLGDRVPIRFDHSSLGSGEATSDSPASPAPSDRLADGAAGLATVR